MLLRLSHIAGAVAARPAVLPPLSRRATRPRSSTPTSTTARTAGRIMRPPPSSCCMDQAGVRRAFVSSTPDDGTVRLFEMAPDRIVPVLRPYRQPGELSTWHQDPTVVPYLEQRLARPIYRGIGEFHLTGSDARSPVVRQVAELARAARALPPLPLRRGGGGDPRWPGSGRPRALGSRRDELGRRTRWAGSSALRPTSWWSSRSGPTWRRAASSIPPGGISSCATPIASWSGPIPGSRRAGAATSRSRTTRADLASPAPARRGASPGDRERGVPRTSAPPESRPATAARQ